MGITCTTPSGYLANILEQCAAIIKEEIERSLSYLGEQCIRKVRDRSGKSSWYDQTGNLRSSIGYAVANEGRTVIQSAFETVLKGTEGSQAGRDAIDRLIKLYSSTYALVVVAGMNYAEYVEAMENKDVLASTELWAKQQIQIYLDKAKKRAENRMQKLFK